MNAFGIVCGARQQAVIEKLSILTKGKVEFLAPSGSQKKARQLALHSKPFDFAIPEVTSPDAH
jgi:hypothetical protein